MRRLYPVTSENADDELDTLPGLAAAYPYPDAATAWVRVSMVQTLDGAAHFEGLSQPISSKADMRVFGVLRALADVVVAGAETVRGEGYRPARARPAFAAARAAAGQGPAAAIAVVSSRLDLDFDAPLFAAAVTPTLVLTGSAAPEKARRRAEDAGGVVITVTENARLTPAEITGALAARGLNRIQLEGGPRLLGQFTAADAVDEMCLTLSPTLTAGGAERIAHGPSVDAPHRMRLAGLLEQDGFLFSRYLRDRTGSTAPASNV
ncbi:hypothetical protein BIV57_20890 [Mangrovactinospora gilvigrisea]|uniref:Bacterial bifunctional deaminase-reductase C-terminal domain-containing protein n=1 Tax=Mangrovactinospora gilvigrisea TaxID=1428644 RepID=A0A1J7C1W7_9ACTN|nr:dihydrofolate reductase family protein [Mangrovactinospora gilvigrisea]OIV35580.1 hypothetical protein BIV57_20890 [Mangrovactinospora gilvigrisea]